MYVIVVYDVGIERLDSVRHILKQYLTWIQNSAFEGEISLGKLEEVHSLISHIIDKEKDSIVVYSINNPAWLGKQTWGREKGTTDNVNIVASSIYKEDTLLEIDPYNINKNKEFVRKSLPDRGV